MSVSVCELSLLATAAMAGADRRGADTRRRRESGAGAEFRWGVAEHVKTH